MAEIIGVRFKTVGKVYYFAANGIQANAGDQVIVETARGVECGEVAFANREIPEEQITAPLKEVIRLATPEDLAVVAKNKKKEEDAFRICEEKIRFRKLDMKLVEVECTFDNSKLLFYFTAENRVDFRELVKDLASVFRTRIELRQIGVRDEAKLLGGLGICGREFCCKGYLGDFQPVSIKMAKTQNLSLNPTKISGTCGRLMCCLKYEQDAYEDLIRTSPKAESFVDTPDGRGTVTDVNLLRQSVHVRLEKQPDTVVCHKNCDICVLRNGKAKKTDEPIPDDLAPISGGKAQKKQESPAFSTYLEPVVLKKSAQAVEEGVYAPEHEAGSTAKETPRRRRGGKNHKPKTDAPKEAPVREQEAKTSKPAKKQNPSKPQSQVKAEAPKAEAAKESERSGKPKNNRHHRYYRRKKSGAKPDA